MNKYLILGLMMTVISGCKDTEENPLLDKIIGNYEGVVNYGEIPIPGDDMVEQVNFTITKEGNNNIKITTTFDLVLPVTGTFTSDISGDEIISLGAGKEIDYPSNGVELHCGGTNFNNWGEMCGYYNITDKNLKIAFSWSNDNEGGSGFIFGTRID